MKSIRIDALDPDTTQLWSKVVEVAQALEDQPEGWCLVGGLMVASFAIEAGQIQRPTIDIDILADARRRPSGTELVSERLASMGGTLHEPGGLDAERGFRFDVGGHIVDVLAPDGLAQPALTRGNSQTIQIPGGSQALQRTEALFIVVGDKRARVFRPTLLGAVLLKARALMVHSRPEDQRRDLITLLGLVEDPRAVLKSVKNSEIGWLRAADTRLDLNDRDLDGIIDADHLRVARAAYRRLTA